MYLTQNLQFLSFLMKKTQKGGISNLCYNSSTGGYFYHERIQNPVKHLRCSFCENIKRLLAVNYSR